MGHITVHNNIILITAQLLWDDLAGQDKHPQKWCLCKGDKTKVSVGARSYVQHLGNCHSRWA